VNSTAHAPKAATRRRTTRDLEGSVAVGRVSVADTTSGYRPPRIQQRATSEYDLAGPPGRYPDAMEPVTSLTPGLTAQVELTVTDADTAQAIGSGDVPVLGTPRVLALAEAATVAATASRLPTGATTVGTRVELEHTAPSPVGARVVASVTLAKVDGRRLLFEVRVTSGDQPVAEGRIERALVDRQQFLAKAFGEPS